MPIPKKNLLEAFQASARVERLAATQASSPASKSGGPFAPAPADSGARPAMALSIGSTWHLDPRVRVAALLVGVALAAFFVGRATVSAAGARAPAASSGTSAASLAAPSTARGSMSAAPAEVAAQTGSLPATAAERALFDPRNLYTVKLVEYTKGRDDKLAAQTLVWLQQQSMPAVAQFQGKRLYILLGAGAEQKDLDGLLAQAKTMTGPPPLSKPKEFHDAYVVAIDRLVKR